MIKYRSSQILYKIFVQAVFVLFSITIIFALYYLISNSMKTDTEFAANQFGLPKLYFENYVYVWKEAAIGITFRNSIIICSTGACICMFISILTGYAFVYFRFAGKGFLSYMILSTLYISPMALMLPLYLQMTKLGLNNTYIGIIIIYVALNSAFAVYLMTTYFKSIPPEIIEAAVVDGCTKLGLLFRIFVPLVKSGILVTGIISFSAMWNDLLFALIFLQQEKRQTLMVAIAKFRSTFGSGNMTYILSSLVIATIPVIVLYLLAQRSFKEGLVAGAVK